jgi:hypothetical protein
MEVWKKGIEIEGRGDSGDSPYCPKNENVLNISKGV